MTPFAYLDGVCGRLHLGLQRCPLTRRHLLRDATIILHKRGGAGRLNAHVATSRNGTRRAPWVARGALAEEALEAPPLAQARENKQTNKHVLQEFKNRRYSAGWRGSPE
eukprot:9472288-Pyramimonas_sp.AAC.1